MDGPLNVRLSYMIKAGSDKAFRAVGGSVHPGRGAGRIVAPVHHAA
ncbi:hypothetical protein [Rhizobium cremeum]